MSLAAVIRWAGGPRPIGVDTRWVRISGPDRWSDYWRVQMNERDGDTILSVDQSGITVEIAAENAMREWSRSPYVRRAG